MKVVAQQKKISQEAAEEYIMLIAKFGDNIMNSSQSNFLRAKDWKIKEIIYSRNCDYRKIKERCRYPYQEPIPFMHNLMTAGGLWHVSGGSLSITNALTGVSEEILSEDGVASLNNCATYYETAHNSLIKISEEQKYDEINNLVIYGVASIEAFVNYLAVDYNKLNPPNSLKDSKQVKISFEEKIDQWIPIIIPGRRFDKGTKVWTDFEYIQSIRDNCIHPKTTTNAQSITEIVRILNCFKNGISGFLIELHKMKNNIHIPTTIIRDFYTPIFYVNEIDSTERQKEPYYKTLKPIFEECSMVDKYNPFFIIKNVQENIGNRASQVQDLIHKTKEALLIFPDYLLAYEILLLLYAKIDDCNNVIKYSKALFKLDEYNEVAIYYSGMAYYHMNSYGNAVTNLLRICDKSTNLDNKMHKQIKDTISKCFEEVSKIPYWGKIAHSYSDNFSRIVDKVEKENKQKILLLINSYNDPIGLTGSIIENYIVIQANQICSENKIELLLIKYLINHKYRELLRYYPNTGKISELVVGQTNELFELVQYKKLIEDFNLDDKKYNDYSDFSKRMGKETGILNSDIARVFILLSLLVSNDAIYIENLERIRSKYSSVFKIVKKLEPLANDIINPKISLRHRRERIIHFFEILTTNFIDRTNDDLSKLIMVTPVFNSAELLQPASSVFKLHEDMIINNILGVTLSGIKLSVDCQVIQSGIWNEKEKDVIRNSIAKCNVKEFLENLGFLYYFEHN